MEKKDPENSFFIFEAADTIRVTCKIINDHTAFVNFILLIIGLSSIALAMDDPISQNPQLVSILWHLDLIFTSIFIFETIIKEKSQDSKYQSKLNLCKMSYEGTLRIRYAITIGHQAPLKILQMPFYYTL